MDILSVKNLAKLSAREVPGVEVKIYNEFHVVH